MGGPVGHFSGSLPRVDVPAGLSTRPLQHDDARAVFEVMAAQELEDIGEVAIEEADIVGDWARPSFDVADSTVGRLRRRPPGGLRRAQRPRPRRRGCPPGVPRPRARYGARALDAGHRAPARRHRGRHASAAGLGRRPAARGARLPRPLGELGAPAARGRHGPEPRPARGVHGAGRRAPEDYRAAWTVQEDAFLEWSDRDRQTYEDWESSMTLPARASSRGTCGSCSTRPARSSPWPWCRWRTTTAFIARLATTKEQRGRGWPKRCWSTRSRSAARTAPLRSELSTDSRTGALGLYEKVGMKATSTWVNRAIAL